MIRDVLIFAGTLGAALLGVIAARALAPAADAFIPAPSRATAVAAAAPPRGDSPPPMLMAARRYHGRPPAYVVGTDSLTPASADPGGSDPANGAEPPAR